MLGIKLPENSLVKKRAEVQGNYPNFKKSWKKIFVILKASESQPLRGKIRLRAASLR